MPSIDNIIEHHQKWCKEASTIELINDLVKAHLDASDDFQNVWIDHISKELQERFALFDDRWFKDRQALLDAEFKARQS